MEHVMLWRWLMEQDFTWIWEALTEVGEAWLILLGVAFMVVMRKLKGGD